MVDESHDSNGTLEDAGGLELDVSRKCLDHVVQTVHISQIALNMLEIALRVH